MRTDDLNGKPTGERLRIIRERRGLHRDVVAARVGKSTDWLKKVELGYRLPPRLPMLLKLTDILSVDLAALTGDDPAPLGPARREAHPAVPALREAIETPLLTLDGHAPTDPRRLQAMLETAWQTWHAAPAPREATGRILPELIRDARTAARLLDGSARRDAYTVLVGAYALAEQVLAWVSDAALLHLAADRCMAAAEQADRPEALAAAAWVVGNVWRNGREEEALVLADDAARLLKPHLETGNDEARALWGAVRLHAAITAARLGREGDALHRLDAAETAAASLTGYTHPWTLFGQPNVDLTGVSVHVDLRKGSTALDKAGAVDPDMIRSVDRRARLWLETARAYAQAEDHPATLHVLQRAADVSAESMRCHPIARSLAGRLATSGGRLIERDARALAERIGVPIEP